jgi:hypothetical protein
MRHILIATVLASLSTPRSTHAAESFWTRRINQDAASAVKAGPRGGLSDPSGATTLQSRLDALQALRSRLGVSLGLPLETMNAPSSSATALQHEFDRDGYVTGLWAYRKGGLMEVVPEGPEATFRRFIVENKALFDLQGSDASDDPASLDWLGASELIAKPASKNRSKAERLTFHPTYRGRAILDGAVIASFISDSLVSITGPILNPAMEIFPIVAGVSADAAEKTAQQAAATKYGVAFDATGVALGVSRATPGLVYRMILQPAASGSPVDPLTAHVDAVSNSVVALSSAALDTQVFHNYRVYTPVATDPDIRQESPGNVQLLSGPTEVSGTTVYPWYVTFTGSSQHTSVVTVTGDHKTGSEWDSFTQTTSDPDFDDTTSNIRFGQQHASYWASYASFFGDYLLDVVPAGAPYANFPVRVIHNANLTPNEFWDVNLSTNCDSTIGTTFDNYYCVRLGTDWNYTNGAKYISALIHEMGHLYDSKYTGAPALNRRASNPITGLCDAGTSEEGRSVAETIASMFAAGTIAANFGVSSSFCDYNASTYMGAASLYWLTPGGPNVHVTSGTDASILCYANPAGPTCSSPYAFGYPTVQAFWESVHGINCGGGSCWTMGDAAGAYQAYEALAYGMANTPATGTQVSFAANFLAYYYNNVGSTEWSNRWWVFNHHRLIGPNYGYSPCHAY